MTDADRLVQAVERLRYDIKTLRFAGFSAVADAAETVLSALTASETLVAEAYEKCNAVLTEMVFAVGNLGDVPQPMIDALEKIAAFGGGALKRQKEAQAARETALIEAAIEAAAHDAEEWAGWDDSTTKIAESIRAITPASVRDSVDAKERRKVLAYEQST